MNSEEIIENFDTQSSSPSLSSLKTKVESSLFSIDTLNVRSISILGFELHFDDIIIIALILFLLQEEKRDYLLIGVLGLMFFDFSIDKISNFEPLKKLLSNIT